MDTSKTSRREVMLAAAGAAALSALPAWAVGGSGADRPSVAGVQAVTLEAWNDADVDFLARQLASTGTDVLVGVCLSLFNRRRDDPSYVSTVKTRRLVDQFLSNGGTSITLLLHLAFHRENIVPFASPNSFAGRTWGTPQVNEMKARLLDARSGLFGFKQNPKINIRWSACLEDELEEAEPARIVNALAAEIRRLQNTRGTGHRNFERTLRSPSPSIEQRHQGKAGADRLELHLGGNNTARWIRERIKEGSTDYISNDGVFVYDEQPHAIKGKVACTSDVRTEARAVEHSGSFDGGLGTAISIAQFMDDFKKRKVLLWRPEFNQRLATCDASNNTSTSLASYDRSNPKRVTYTSLDKNVKMDTRSNQSVFPGQNRNFGHGKTLRRWLGT